MEGCVKIESSSSLFFCLLFFSFFLPLPGFLTMTTVRERYREAGGGRREGRRREGEGGKEKGGVRGY